MTASGMSEPLREVSITTDGITANLTLNGTNITPMVQGYTIEHRAGQAPIVALHATPQQNGVAFDGLARVVLTNHDQDPADTITAYLGSIDPAALQRAALDRNDLGDGKTDTTRAILRQLIDWAQGRT
ncbi:hypothetical protein ACF06T_30375 [Streptomyces albidoflavus]